MAIKNRSGLTVFGKPDKRRTHGRSKTPLYFIWRAMKQRCYSESADNYQRYGGRGIKVCQEWHDFLKFEGWALENGWRKGLELDRKKNSHSYSPQNCRFVSRKQNCNNRRDNRMVTAFGETKTLAQWIDDPRCGIEYETCRRRLVILGWRPERAIGQPRCNVGRRPKSKEN